MASNTMSMLLHSPHACEMQRDAHGLREAGCCGPCVLRMLGESSLSAILDPDIEKQLDQRIGPRRNIRYKKTTSGKHFRGFVTTADASIFKGAKLAQTTASCLRELKDGIFKAVGLVPAGLVLMLDSAPIDEQMFANLPDNPRLEIRLQTDTELAAAKSEPEEGQIGEPAKTNVVDASLASEVNGFVCSICLGSVQHSKQWAGEAIRQIRSRGFDFEKEQLVSIGLGLPSACLVRQRLVAHHMRIRQQPRLELKGILQQLVQGAVKDAFPGVKLVNQQHENDESIFQVQLSWRWGGPQRVDEAETLARAQQQRQHTNKRQRNRNDWNSRLDVSWESIKRLLLQTDDYFLRNHYRWPLELLWAEGGGRARQPEFTAIFHRPSIFVAGLYKKFERGLSQTPWPYGKPGEPEGSVEEYITAVVTPAFAPEACKFSSGGREDKDVRMLGGGRPFTLEMINAKTMPSGHACEQALGELETAVNVRSGGRVEVSALRVVNKSYTDEIKAAEENKRKNYRCVCWIRQPSSDRAAGDEAQSILTAGVSADDLKTILDSQPEITVHQNTPIRVLHRRAPLVRDKIIYSMRTQWINRRCFILDMQTSAGTYVKEFVHGDCGRTTPNIGLLLEKPTDILQLDVLGVEFANSETKV